MKKKPRRGLTIDQCDQCGFVEVVVVVAAVIIVIVVVVVVDVVVEVRLAAVRF